jgi:hypothetical protein
MPQRRFIPSMEMFVPDRACSTLQQQKRRSPVKFRQLLGKRIPHNLQ